jgi:hypothetical protein
MPTLKNISNLIINRLNQLIIVHINELTSRTKNQQVVKLTILLVRMTSPFVNPCKKDEQLK